MLKRISIFCMLFLIAATSFCGSMCKISFADGELDITSKSACLVDYASGTVLYEKDAEKHLPIASMVKMMTILLTLDEIDAGRLGETDMVTTSENASGMGGSQVFIDPYVEYSVGDLLKSVIIASANDASVALAEHICGGEKAFVSKMNEKAKDLGMINTHYTNCTGLPAPEQYSCAKDCAIVLKEVANHEVYHKYSTIWMDEIVHPSGRKTEIVNTNRLVRYYDGCDSGKTGSTNEAGCCLSASAKRNDMRLISVVIGAENSQTRFNECSKLFNYGFANFESKEIVGIQNSLQTIAVNKGKQDCVDIFASEGYSIITKKGEKTNIDLDFNLPDRLNAPTREGDIVGKAILSQNGNVIKEIDLIIKTDIQPLSFKDCFDKVVYKW